MRRRRTWTPRCANGSAPRRVAVAREIGYSTPAPSSSCSTERPLRVHRDEPANPGRAHGHRGDHRRRPGPRAAADRGGRNARRPRADPGRDPPRGVALQCRITTEDPANGFRPDTGRITAYRSPGGAGHPAGRGLGLVGAESSPFFDSMLVKVTCRGRDLRSAAARAGGRWRSSASAVSPPTCPSCRRCSPSRLPGRRGHTSFIDERPQLLTADPAPTAARASSLTSPMSPSTSQHGPPADRCTRATSCRRCPRAAGRRLPPAAARTGARRVRRRLREQRAWRHRHDVPRRPSVAAGHPGAHHRPARGAPAHRPEMPQLLSVECWGGATYDVALRFLKEDPWSRLAACVRRCRTSACRCCCAAATAGLYAASGPSWRPSSRRRSSTGIDSSAIFDALNNVESMRRRSTPCAKPAR